MMHATTYSEKFAAFSQDLVWASVPEDTRLRVKACVLDVLGVCMVANHYDFARTVAGHFTEIGGKEQSSVIGTGVRLPAAHAALVNGSLSHGIEFDDSHSAAAMHPSSVIVPAALAMAEATNASGLQLLESVVIGLEVMLRVGKAGQSDDGFHHRGLHPTSLAGVFGAAVTASRMLALDQHECVWGQGLAGSMASGSTEFLEDLSWGKRMGAGWAAHGGILAAQLAARGFTAPKTIYEGRWGLYASHLNPAAYSLALLDEGLGTEWETLQLVARRFPCCARIPPFVSAALEVMRTHRLTPSDIDAVECGVVALDVIVCEPWTDKSAHSTAFQAQFSLPFCVATALCRGRLAVDSFGPEGLEAFEVRQLMKVMTFQLNSRQDRRGYLRIRTKSGDTIDQTVIAEPKLGWSEIRSKFMEISEGIIGTPQAQSVVGIVEDLESLHDVGQLSNACRRA